MYQTAAYSKENISRRLLRRSAELWGYDESQIDQFDPLVKLIIEACSVEFEKVGQEIQGTELRLMTRLAEILSPETHANPQPASAIAQARSVESTGWIEPENQLVCKRINPRKGESAEIFLSAAARYPLVNASIVHYATPNALFGIEKGVRNLISNAKSVAGDQNMWIGIEADANITSWNGFRFFFDWINDVEQYAYREFLPATAWEGNAKMIHYKIGVQDEAIDDAIRIYDGNFIRMASADSWEKGKMLTSAYPPEFEQIFDNRTLQGLKKPLLWLKIKWPAAFPAAGFENMTVALNAFPVLNKQLHKLTYRLQPGLNGVALPSGDAFLGINTIINQKNQGYTASEKNQYNVEDSSARTYALRQQGVGRFDQRNAKAVLYQLMELLRDEVTAFNAIGEDFLASILREIAQNMARIEQKLGPKKASETTAQPFLVIKGEKNPDVLYISYWTTLSESANGLPAGSKLQSYSATGINGADISLLTKSIGGKPKPDETEYVDQLRKNIITRNRLVTQEDMKAFCSAELGSRLKHLEVKPHFMQSNMPGQGFVRCLQIRLTPFANVARDEDWQRACQLLQMKIQNRSTGMYPVQVITA
ncbi:type VI secretion system baseplate subunit TssF [Dyadobacter sp. CY347]|uniref:type VI secretion system baseplate subunit TssF n=1 Tax=Dyadobacter sp. CY347 TaxID=2909336 RepID=UPI001F2511FE|nr:type VI secretion system baseplate subunit TssF [Dyadobacter sp. CY347]MCF2490474.1 type VI secretion system baseplate subunit TssF [Dyadobacter sp. CY347]